jgi:hypothetical protein
LQGAERGAVEGPDIQQYSLLTPQLLRVILPKKFPDFDFEKEATTAADLLLLLDAFGRIDE